MRVLVFHGYLLQGTGSNVYNANLAAALARAGHEVHLLSQDRDPFALQWVDAAGDWDGGELSLRVRREPARATAYRPDIGGLLPVYVADRYEGMEARPFPELSAEEVEAYVEANVRAVREVAARARPDVALANHLVMGPAILARALDGVPYAVKIHGSALEYTVKPHPRFMPYAKEGLGPARGILVGSRHTGESLWAAMGDETVRERTRLGPPGVDIEEFAPRDPEAARAGVRALAGRLRGMAPEGSGSFAREPAEGARALEALDLAEDRLVLFVGKLIGSKGVELLLAAWPLVLAAEPRARLVVVGFGGMREGLQSLATALAAGNLAAARAIRGEDGRELPWLRAFLDRLEGRDTDTGGAAAPPGDAAAAPPPDRSAYLNAARGLPERVLWTGRLDHAELPDLLPAAEAMVVPSTFPEAFGMVAAEAAAAGVLPVVAGHSGLAEVAARLAERVPEDVRPLLSFAVGPQAVEQLAAAVVGWLQAPEDLRAAAREAIVAVTRETWSWDGVARGVLAAAHGDLDALPVP